MVTEKIVDSVWLMLMNTFSQLALLLCWLPAQVGAVSDFARVENSEEAAKTDFLGRSDSSSGKAEGGATEGARQSRARQGQRRSRQTSETFATEPSNEPYSFQVLGLQS